MKRVDTNITVYPFTPKRKRVNRLLANEMFYCHFILSYFYRK